MIEFASIGSGSRGNGTLLRAGDTTLLVDCGFSVAETRRRMEMRGLQAEALDAVLVTHEHQDHARGVARLGRAVKAPIWTTTGTWMALQSRKAEKLPDDCQRFNADGRFQIGDFSVQAVSVPHDAREPCQFVFEAGGARLGLLTDTGCITQHVVEQFAACDAMMLETNHDTGMLRDGPYPLHLQQRVGGELGHLNNHQAADFLSRVDHQRLQHLILMHLSEKNNHPDLALQAVTEVIDKPDDWLSERLYVAGQDEGFEWRQVTAA